MLLTSLTLTLAWSPQSCHRESVEIGGGMDCYDWSAWYNRMPGVNDPNLHVSGHCRLSSSSVAGRSMNVLDKDSWTDLYCRES